MPRQTFLARESFVDASEKQTRDHLYALPAYLSHIHLQEDNRIVDSIRFLYQRVGKPFECFIDVTVLPLNDQYTRISMHASHIDAHAFINDPELSYALHDFESAIHASLKGDLSHYVPWGTRVRKQKADLRNPFRMMLANLFFRKKLS